MKIEQGGVISGDEFTELISISKNGSQTKVHEGLPVKMRRSFLVQSEATGLTCIS